MRVAEVQEAWRRVSCKAGDWRGDDAQCAHVEEPLCEDALYASTR